MLVGLIFIFTASEVSLLHFYIFTLKNPFYFTPNYSGYCCVASFLVAGYIYISKAVKREKVQISARYTGDFPETEFVKQKTWLKYSHLPKLL